MATLTDYVGRDSRIAQRVSDSWNAGSGVSTGLPFGLYGGYQYRSLLYFNTNTSGWTSLTSAILHIRTSSQIHIAFGSSPSVRVQRLTASFSEGASNALSASNAVIYPGPAVTTTNAVTASMGTVESTWKTVDITAMVNDVLGGSFIGVRLIAWNGASESTAAADVGEIYSRETGSDAYIVYTYSTNTLPNAPTSFSPASGSNQELTPSLSFTHSDPDGDALLNYDLQVSTDPTFGVVTHWNISAQTTGIVGNVVTRTYAGTALSRGSSYFWRARTRSSTGDLTVGAWSASSRFFNTNFLPVVALNNPSATGQLAPITYTPGSAWASPRLNLSWLFTDNDGHTQQSYNVDVANDSAGSPGASLYASGVVASTATSLVVPATLTEGAYYHVRVTVVCSGGATSVASGYFRVRARWGVVSHWKDLAAAPTSWTISTLNTTLTSTTSSVVMEYGSDTAANASPTAGWFDSLSGATLARYFYYRAWLMSWGPSPSTSPSLDKLVLSYSSVVLVPDKWTREDTTNATVAEDTYVYGTQSLKMAGKAATHSVYQLVKVTPNTNYILSGRIKIQGASTSTMSISSAGTSGNLTSVQASSTQDWTRAATGVWNSGANTEIYIRLQQNGAVGTATWYDAIKFEASSVVTPWTPSFLADAVVLDAGGLQIDAVAGGIFRLRGSTGATRDRVDLGSHGLKLGGDTEVYSPGAALLTISPAVVATGLSHELTTGIGGKPATVQVYTVVGANTWTKPAGLSHIIVEVIGGGGGGGGAALTAAAQCAQGGAGGAGGYTRAVIAAAALGATVTATVGAAGLAGTAGANNGGTGGTSTFGAQGQATGGVGGTGCTAALNSSAAGGAGGVGSVGSLNLTGGSGSNGGGFNAFPAQTGQGGASLVGGGAKAPSNLTGTVAGIAAPANSGAGGTGGSNGASQAAGVAGGAGGTGLIIVHEFYGA